MTDRFMSFLPDSSNCHLISPSGTPGLAVITASVRRIRPYLPESRISRNKCAAGWNCQWNYKTRRSAAIFWWNENISYRFFTHQTPLLSQLNQFMSFLRIGSKRLLAKYVFPSPERFACPLKMHSIGSRNIHNINVGVIQKFLVWAISFLEVIFLGWLLGGLEVARGDSVEDDVRMSFCGMYDFLLLNALHANEVYQHTCSWVDLSCWYDA